MGIRRKKSWRIKKKVKRGELTHRELTREQEKREKRRIKRKEKRKRKTELRDLVEFFTYTTLFTVKFLPRVSSVAPLRLLSRRWNEKVLSYMKKKTWVSFHHIQILPTIGVLTNHDFVRDFKKVKVNLASLPHADDIPYEALWIKPEEGERGVTDIDLAHVKHGLIKKLFIDDRQFAGPFHRLPRSLVHLRLANIECGRALENAPCNITKLTFDCHKKMVNNTVLPDGVRILNINCKDFSYGFTNKPINLIVNKNKKRMKNITAGVFF